MTKRERELLTALKRLRDALWDTDLDGEHVPPKLNRAYIAADSLISKIEREKAAKPAV